MTDWRVKAALAVLHTILETVKEAGEDGVPSGPVYAALMASGLTYTGYTSAINLLVKAGKVRESNNVLYAVV